MKTQLRKVSHLNPFSTKEIGFLNEWLKRYYKPNECKQMSQNYYKYIAIYFLFMSCRVIIALIYYQNNVSGRRLSIYLGSWSTLLGGPPHYFEFICLMWDIHFIGCYFTILNRRRAQFSWMPVFGAIHGYIDPESISIDKNLLASLQKRERIGYFMVNNAVADIAWIGISCIITLMYFNYKTEDMFTFGIIWIPFWSLWVYYCPRSLYWFPLYFHLICFYLKSQLISIEKRLEYIMREPIPLVQKEFLLKTILKRHVKIFTKINSYNNYWKPFLTQCLLIFVTIILFLSYLYFFTFMPILPKIEFTIILMVKTCFLVILLVSASEVSHRTQTTYKLLQTLCTQNFSIKTKLKLMTYSEIMSKTNGFSFITNQVIARETVKTVTLNCLLYFLLVVQNSSRYTQR